MSRATNCKSNSHFHTVFLFHLQLIWVFPFSGKWECGWGGHRKTRVPVCASHQENDGEHNGTLDEGGNRDRDDSK